MSEIEVKVIELSGKTLDPNCKYLIAFDQDRVTGKEIWSVSDQLQWIGVKEVAFMRTRGNPAQAIKMYEIPGEDQTNE